MKYLLLTICLIFAQGAFAQQTKAGTKPGTVTAAPGSDGLIESFRCERSNQGLADLKMKMIENCNLNMPFSSSHSSAVNETYMYCCHKK